MSDPTPKESIFTHSLRAFSVAASSVLGVIVGCIIFFFLFAWFLKTVEKDTFSSSVKLLPDADGNRKQLAAEAPILLEIQMKGQVGKDSLSASKVETILLKSREEDFKNNRVKGILLVMNSPGGDANDSDIIYRDLLEYKKRYQVPIYTYVDGLCASGGFYIACATDKIYASDVSLIGSVGVLSWPPFFNVTDVLKKIGVTTLTLSEGKDKDQLSPFRPWKVDEDKNYKEMIGFFYTHFVDIVCKNRPKITKEQLVEQFGAKIFPAPEALENGYIDAYGVEKSQVIRDLSIAAGLKPEDKYQVVTFESKQWLKKLIEEKPFILTGELKLPEEFKNTATVKYQY